MCIRDNIKPDWNLTHEALCFCLAIAASCLLHSEDTRAVCHHSDSPPAPPKNNSQLPTANIQQFFWTLYAATSDAASQFCIRPLFCLAVRGANEQHGVPRGSHIVTSVEHAHADVQAISLM